MLVLYSSSPQLTSDLNYEEGNIDSVKKIEVKDRLTRYDITKFCVMQSEEISKLNYLRN